MTLGRTLKTALAVLFMLCFLAALGLLAWAGHQARAVHGPSHLAADGKTLYVYADGELLTVDAGGALRARKPLAALGLDDMPIDLRVLADGRLLIAMQKPARLLACDTGHWRCETLARDFTERLQAQFKVLPTVDGTALLITDTEDDQLWRVPLTDGEPQALLPKGEIRRANDLALDGAGRLWIADSGHHRLAVFGENDEGRRALDKTIDARHALMRKQRDWPMMIAFADDDTAWVVQPDSAGHGADLLLYRHEAGVIARIDLADDIYPTDIARLGGRMLVSDMDAYRLYAVDIATRAVRPFGDAALTTRLGQAAARADQYRQLEAVAPYAMAVFGVLMILAAIWATPKGERLAATGQLNFLQASDIKATHTGEIHWLELHPLFLKIHRFGRWAGLAVMPILIGSFIWGTYSAFTCLPDAPTEEQATALFNFAYTMGGIILLMVGAMIYIFWDSRRQTASSSLGSDGQRLYIRQKDGRPKSYLPQQLVYSGHQISVGDRTLEMLGAYRKPRFAPGELETHIWPLLAQARRVNEGQMILHRLKQREPAFMWQVFGIIALLLFAVIKELW